MTYIINTTVGRLDKGRAVSYPELLSNSGGDGRHHSNRFGQLGGSISHPVGRTIGSADLGHLGGDDSLRIRGATTRPGKNVCPWGWVAARWSYLVR